MNALQVLSASRFVEQIGWALLHSLWQVAIVAALAGVVLRLQRRSSAGARYIVACLMLLAMPTAVAVTFAVGVWTNSDDASVAVDPGVADSARLTETAPVHSDGPVEASATSVDTISTLPAPRHRTSNASISKPWHIRVRSAVNAYMPELVIAWLVGVGVLSVRNLGGWYGVRQLRSQGVTPAGPNWQHVLTELATRMQVRQAVHLLESTICSVPIVIGHLKPVILLPASMLTGLTAQQIEAILAHELAHIRRHDYLINLIQTLIETLLFYHPLVWWLSRRIRVEREHCCDDLAVEFCGDRLTYARALASLEELRGPAYQPALAATGGGGGGSLLERVRRIVGLTPETTTRRYAWVAGAILFLTACATGVALYRAGRAELVYHTTGDPLDIRLVGVIPDQGAQVYDPEGRKIGRIDRTFGPYASSGGWGRGEMSREFDFELPPTDEPILFAVFQMIAPAGEKYGLSLTQRKMVLETEGHHRVIFVCSFDNTYRGRFRSKASVDRVDLTLQYYVGPPGPADFRFSGPFRVDQKVRADGGRPPSLLTMAHDGRNLASFVFQSPQAVDMSNFLVAYDGEGQRHLGSTGSGHSGPGGTQYEVHFQGVSVDQIAAVAIGEEPRKKVFRNVTVRYPDQPLPDGPTYLQTVAQRLGKPGVNMSGYQFADPQEVLRVIDVIRADHMPQAWQVLGRSKVDQLTDVQRKRVYKTALKWSQAPSPWAKDYGLRIGLWGDWREFVEPAFEFLALRPRRNSRDQRAAFARVLVESGLLLPQDMATLADLIAAEPDRSTNGYLFWALESAKTPEAIDALSPLAAADQDQPWFWWPAIKALRSSREGQEQLNALALKSRIIAQRMLLQSRAGTDLAVTEPSANEAARMGLASLSARFAAHDPWMFNELLDAAAQRADPAEGTQAVTTFLGELLEQWHAYDVPGRSSRNYAPLRRAVQHLNRWQGTNFGGLGSSVRRVRGQEGDDWKSIARDVMAWHETGIDPRRLPSGWSAQNGDVRVVWRNLDDPELSIIALWSVDGAQWPSETWIRLKLLNDIVNLRLEHDVINGVPGYRIKTLFGVFDSHASRGTLTKSEAELPCRLKLRRAGWESRCEIWLERADAETSVVEGTKLFQRWADSYLKKTPLSSPQPRMFFDHPPQSLVRLIHARLPSDGWSPALIALRQTLDQDGSTVHKDLRPLLEDELTQPGAVAAWHRFLERGDISKEMRVFAWNRIGMLYDQPVEDKGEKTDRQKAQHAFAKVRELEPELVCEETLTAHSRWHLWQSGREARPMERARIQAAVYRWLSTRTDQIFRQSARRPRIYSDWQPPYRRRDGDPLEEIVRHAHNLARRVAKTREFYETRLSNSLKDLYRKDPAAARHLVEQISDLAEPEQRTKWHVLVNPDPITIAGRIRTATGSSAPAEARGVAFTGDRPGMPQEHELPIDPAGQFSLTVPSEKVVIRVEAPGFSDTQVGPFTSDSPEIEIVMHPAFDGVIRLGNDQGQPIAGATVELLFAHGNFWRAPGNPRYTDDQGLLVIPDCPSVATSVHVQSDGYEHHLVAEGQFKPAEQWSISLTPATPLTGTVRSKLNNEPIDGARIVLNDYYGPRGAARLATVAKTDNNGQFAINTFRRDTVYSLRVSAPGHRSQIVQPVRVGQHLKLELDEPLYVRGVISGDLTLLKSNKSEEPVIRFENPSPRLGGYAAGSIEVPVAVENGVGRFELTDLLPGKLTIVLPDRNLVRQITEPIDNLVIELREKK